MTSNRNRALRRVLETDVLRAQTPLSHMSTIGTLGWVKTVCLLYKSEYVVEDLASTTEQWEGVRGGVGFSQRLRGGC